MKARFLISSILLLNASVFLGAQEVSLEEFPGLRERAVVLNIVSRIVEQDQEDVWNPENSFVTLPGRPVGFQLVGSNLIIAVQFVPYLRPGGRHFLVAQGQIWISVPNESISYHTTMQTIPLEFRETVYFIVPLASEATGDESYLEIQLTLEPYTDRVPRDNVPRDNLPRDSVPRPRNGGNPGADENN